MPPIQTPNEFVSVTRNEYLALRKIYDLHKAQQDMIRIYEVEQNLREWNYKTQNIDDFIASI